MSKMIKRAAALLLAGLMTLNIAACSKNTSETTAAAEGTSSTSGASAETTASASSDITDDTAGTKEKVSVEVYEADKAGNEGAFLIPAIRLNGKDDDAVNKQIREYIDSLDLEWFTGTQYSYYVGEGYVSLLIRAISDIDLDDYEVYNVSLDTGALMNKDEFLKASGTDAKSFDELVKKTVEAVIADDKDGLFAKNEFMDYHTQNLSDENVKLAMPFTSERGNLCFIYQLYMNVGAEEYCVCIDTVTHEHMLNDFGKWTLYPEWG